LHDAGKTCEDFADAGIFLLEIEGSLKDVSGVSDARRPKTENGVIVVDDPILDGAWDRNCCHEINRRRVNNGRESRKAWRIVRLVIMTIDIEPTRP
jgi:hypothetical protein